MIIKKVRALLIVTGGVVLLALAVGCATTKQTEDLLSAAGFKIVPATSPQQRAHLATLSPHKITMVQRDGKEYFVYPDVSHNVLYVGQNPQYQQYQSLREQQQLVKEEMDTVPMSAMPDWAVWDSWGPGFY